MKNNGWLLIFVCAAAGEFCLRQDKCSVRTTHARYGTTAKLRVYWGRSAFAPFTLLGTCP